MRYAQQKLQGNNGWHSNSEKVSFLPFATQSESLVSMQPFRKLLPRPFSLPKNISVEPEIGIICLFPGNHRLKVYPTNYNMDLQHNVATCYNNIQHFHMYFLSLSLFTGLFYIALSPSSECFMLQYIYQILFVRKNFLKPKITGIQTMNAVFRDANHLCCFAQIPIKYLC